MNKIYKYNSQIGKNTLLIESIIKKNDPEKFLDIFENIERARNGGNLDLSHFMNRIDLTESIIN